ncbi:acyltransferase [Seongchinamella unica]|uniref:Acyltransferase n=1 Tax=Seongchinamella unica TaxID=2547392 RepID=A0A4V2ZWX8_9GAMM|nr:acyltransferase [Seongchinamella unica]TDG11898.1 acyltransferase [Seongchinamella unica]
MGIWSPAREIARATPDDRNRYVDFLRAVSIGFVIIGHWLITTAYYDAATGTMTPVLALDSIPWTAWLTWVFQVMPIFFIVGGYSNAVSLEGARGKQLSYAQWLTGRLHRLLTPLLLLVLVWAGIAVALNLASVEAEKIRFLSRAALVPTWFLAIYTMIVLLAPLTYRLWQQWGFYSLAAYIGLAVLVDYLFFALDMQWTGWSNYFWVWLAMHHLGFAWRDGRLAKPPALIAMSMLSLLTLYALIVWGPYPIAMAGSPGDEVSNTLPPKITLIALGLVQFGLLMAIERPMQRLLSSLNLWTTTVIVNTMIMTIYLWHMTVLLAVLVLSYFLAGLGMSLVPGSAEWWWSRPLWLLLLGALLVPVALLLSPLERITRGADVPCPPTIRLVGGAVLAGSGLTLATLLGFDGNLLSPTNTGVVALVIGGAWIAGVPIRLSRVH